MKKVFILLTVLAIMISVAGPTGVAKAQGATGQTWTSSITYYTPSTTAGSLTVLYYQGASSYSYGPIPLNPHKAGSIFIGSTSVPDGFSGSAVLNSDVPVVATSVQFVSDTAQRGNYGRMIYSGFGAGEAADPFYVPTVLNHAFGSTSQVGIQNVTNATISVNLKFYPAGSTTPTTVTRSIEKQASLIFRPGDLGLPNGFNGSLVIDPTSGSVVAASSETDDSGRGAYAFEGVANGANTLYMPSAMCNAFGGQTSYFAIQNASLSSSATVSATFYDTTGAVMGTMPNKNVSAGGKLPVNPCDYGVASGKSGSAKFTSTGAPIIGIGKIKASNGMATAFVGQATGYTKLAAPYIRWASNPSAEFRSYLAIMNVGGAPATNIQVNYYDANGVKYTDNLTSAGRGGPLNPFIKRGSTPPDGGAPANFGVSPVGGAVEIVSDQPVALVVRTQKNVSPPIGSISLFAEDYNGVQITTP